MNRWVYFEFPYTFLPQEQLDRVPEEEKKACRLADAHIIEKLTTSDELSGLLNLALDGLDRLLNNGDFTKSQTKTELLTIWEHKSDSFSAFVSDCCILDDDAWITKRTLKRAYVDFCKKNKIRTLPDTAIKRFLEDSGVYEKQHIEGSSRGWEGIELKPELPQEHIEQVEQGLGTFIEIEGVSNRLEKGVQPVQAAQVQPENVPINEPLAVSEALLKLGGPEKKAFSGGDFAKELFNRSVEPIRILAIRQSLLNEGRLFEPRKGLLKEL